RLGAARARRAGSTLADAALPGGCARDRGQGRRHAGHSRRAPGPARHESLLPGALGSPERADRALEGLPRVTYRDEVAALLQELLRVDTVNPPGNETRAAEVLREYFARHGIECDLVAREPERANV